MSPPKFEKKNENAVALLIDKNTALNMMQMHMGIQPQTGKKKTPARGGLKRVSEGRIEKNHEKNRPLPLERKPVPIWSGYQFIGDSLMSRAAQTLIGAKPVYSRESRALQLGLCIHGQTVSQLNKVLQRKCYESSLNKNVILMIGTNDIIKKVPDTATFTAFEKVVKNLISKTEKLIVLSVPPQAANPDALPQVHKLNKYVESLVKKEAANHEEKEIKFIDLDSIFFKEGKIVEDVFEQKYKSGKQDLVHWNDTGIQKMVAVLQVELDLTEAMDHQ